eukprot:CAMPEP_0206009384 /NCGR_PEP_ID=MMETSP1464-20131121/9606_1 /ASSEMBLY_ACC=CAM_ASM_001124 /TAXON_ID=119497 /ORGANISM="Exanthemachrysis gayraliae, Strain RCC1523" /LENGTH=108 /DNA_ID=CAMNT_0053382981 /DNA_START=40 /DNA_END=363 /DNA_ORIENTATION=-
MNQTGSMRKTCVRERYTRASRCAAASAVARLSAGEALRARPPVKAENTSRALLLSRAAARSPTQWPPRAIARRPSPTRRHTASATCGVGAPGDGSHSAAGAAPPSVAA